jgi:hypothetical protein
MHRINVATLLIAALLVVGVSTSTLPEAAADTPGVWKLTGSMATSRRHASRDRLPDSRTLVVGGTDITSLNGSPFAHCTSPFVSSALADGKHNF